MGPTAKSARLRLILVPGLQIRSCGLFSTYWPWVSVFTLSPPPHGALFFDGTPCLFPASLLVRRRRTERKEKDIPRDRSLHPLTALVFSCPWIWQVQTWMWPASYSSSLSLSGSHLFVNKQINSYIFCMRVFTNKCIYSWSWCVCGSTFVCVCVWARDGQRRRHVNVEERLTGVLIELWEKCKSRTASLN